MYILYIHIYTHASSLPMDVIIPVLERHLGYPLGKVTEMRGDWEWQMSGCSLRRGRRAACLLPVLGYHER